MSPDARPTTRPRTVLVTGAGGPAGIAVIRSLQARPDVTIIAADMSPLASGLYLVPPGRRVLVRPGADPHFAVDLLSLALRHAVDVVVPTVDAELVAIDALRNRFDAAGVALVLASGPALEASLDKLELVRRCAEVAPVPRTALVTGALDVLDWDYPVIVKPRRGSGSRGVRVVTDDHELADIVWQGSDEDLIVQEYLPGEEYSVDVLVGATGDVIATVPRSRLRVDSGVAVAGRTLHDEELQIAARDVATALGITYVANVQLRRDVAGRARLLEVNPRFPGSMPLTVASGVDMPSLALDIALGRPVPARVAHRELVNVRYLEDRFVAPGELDTLVAAEADRASMASAS